MTRPADSRWRKLALAALLLAEIMVLTLSYEPKRLAAEENFFATVLLNSSILLRIFIAMAGTFALVVSARYQRTLARFAQDPRPYPWEWLLLHLVSYSGLYQYTGWLFGGGPDGPPNAHIVYWFLLCAVVGVTWCLAVAPFRVWREFLVDERRGLLASLAAGIAVWIFGLLVQRFWRPLAEWTLFFAYAVLRELYPFVEYDPASGTVGTSRLLLEIAPECSGYEGLALMTVFLTAYFLLFRDRIAFPKALWLLPAGLAAIWITNVFRIAALVVVGTSISPAIAVKGFHSQAGWISFTAVALGLIWISHRTGWVVKAEPGQGSAPPATAPALILPLVALLATSMVVAAFSSGFDYLYPLSVIVTAAVLLSFRKSYAALPFGFSWIPVAIGFAVFAAWVAVDLVLFGDAEAPRARMPEDLPASFAYLWIAFRFVGSVLTVPIAEELAFRGYLLRKLVDRDFERVPATRFTWMSFIASSVLFGLMHRSWIAGSLAGAAFALAVYHRGRVTDAIVAHATANLLIALSVIGFGWWRLWI